MKKSFTLIELLVVIAIIGILSSLIIVRFTNVRDGAGSANVLQWSASVHRSIGANVVAQWDFDEGLPGCTGIVPAVLDLSGYNINSDIINSINYSSDIVGGSGCSALFDGTDSYASFGENASTPNGRSEQTISFWVKRNSFTAWGTIIAFYHETDARWNRLQQGDSANVLVMHYDNSDTCSIRPRVPEYYDFCELDYDNFESNKWFHFVFTFKGGENANLYVNSERVGQSNWGVGPHLRADSGGRWTIGSLWRWSGYSSVNLDAVRIYDTALTASEIQSLYVQELDKKLSVD